MLFKPSIFGILTLPDKTSVTLGHLSADVVVSEPEAVELSPFCQMLF